MTNTKKVSVISLSLATFAQVFTFNFIKAEEYTKGIYANLGAGIGTYSDIIWTNGVNTPFEYGFSFEAGLGYDFGKRFRSELSYINTTSDRDNGNTAKFSSVMINGFIDFPFESRFTPFLGAGFGSTSVDADKVCVTGGANDCKDDVATFSLMGGFAYELNDKTDLTAKLTYLGFEDISINNNGSNSKIVDSETLSIHIGARFKF